MRACGEANQIDLAAAHRKELNPVTLHTLQQANFLDFKKMLDLACKAVAEMIKGKTPEEIRKHFNITNDFTPEEEEQVRRENEWCEERHP